MTTNPKKPTDKTKKKSIKEKDIWGDDDADSTVMDRQLAGICVFARGSLLGVCLNVNNVCVCMCVGLTTAQIKNRIRMFEVCVCVYVCPCMCSCVICV